MGSSCRHSLSISASTSPSLCFSDKFKSLSSFATIKSHLLTRDSKPYIFNFILFPFPFLHSFLQSSIMLCVFSTLRFVFLVEDSVQLFLLLGSGPPHLHMISSFFSLRHQLIVTSSKKLSLYTKVKLAFILTITQTLSYHPLFISL